MKIIELLSSMLLMENSDIIKFSNSAPYRYKVYQIPKRNSLKKRTIAQPSKELKFIQKLLYQILGKNYQYINQHLHIKSILE